MADKQTSHIGSAVIWLPGGRLIHKTIKLIAATAGYKSHIDYQEQPAAQFINVFRPSRQRNVIAMGATAAAALEH